MDSQGRRRLLAAGGAVLLAPVAARAQRAANGIPRIGFVVPTSPGARYDAFMRGLKDFGYVDGRNVRIEARFAEGQPDRLPGLVDELIRLKIDVLVVGATVGALAAKKATTAIPVVFAGSSDPVAGGVVTSLARPEGNITGVSFAASEGFAGKWLEILKESVPELSHVAALWSSSNKSAVRFVRDLEAAARVLSVQVDPHRTVDAYELDRALARIGASGARGLIVTPSPLLITQRRKLVEFARQQRLPAMYFVGEFVDAGGLMSYGPDITDTYRRAAAYVDKILKGAKPADLPIEQSDSFELAINLKTARALGLKIPQTVLLRAARVMPE